VVYVTHLCYKKYFDFKKNLVKSLTSRFSNSKNLAQKRITKTIKRIVLEKKNHKKKMLASANYRKPLDFFGRPIDQVKSMFQKGVRLGEEKEALSGFFGCYNLVALFPEEKNARALQTNIVNRLIVCICEDLCFASPRIIRDVLPTLILMSKKPELRKPAFFANVIKTITLAPKSRWCSHAAAFYNTQEVTEVLDLSNPNCFTWLNNMPKIIAEIESSKLEPAFFKMLFGYYKKSGEKNKKTIARFILGFAHFLKVESDQGIFFRNEWKTEDKLTLEEVDVIPYLTHDKSVYPDIPDHAIDVHTSKGRSLKRDVKRFRAVGACVENEHPLMNNKEYEAAYNNQ
jgi:hypothetical protein